MSALSNRIVETFRALLGEGAGLHEPRFAGNEWAYVKDCIDAGWVSTAGAYVGRFEQMLADFTGAKHVIATNTGTAALHAVFHALEIGDGDEVIVPAGLAPGEYVVGWRWDCEESTQVWSSCADVTVVAA